MAESSAMPSQLKRIAGALSGCKTSKGDRTSRRKMSGDTLQDPEWRGIHRSDRRAGSERMSSHQLSSKVAETTRKDLGFAYTSLTSAASQTTRGQLHVERCELFRSFPDRHAKECYRKILTQPCYQERFDGFLQWPFRLYKNVQLFDSW